MWGGRVPGTLSTSVYVVSSSFGKVVLIFLNTGKKKWRLAGKSDLSLHRSLRLSS